MEYIDFKNEANDLIDKITEILKLMDLRQKSQEVKSFEAEMNAPGFWNDQEQARRISKKVSQIRNEIAHIESLKATKDELETYLTFLDDDFTSELFEEGIQALERIKQFVEKAEIEALLNEEYDHNDAIFTIHAGAGGTEAQ
ncbi:MAG: PCRF domain-containing protein, partial [Candidatus Cloacimonetes bacterium]|nr:PCRF domain-containing protein [Candidatus Cloacimonadota bacterium]